ncbi:MAG: helix-turn-helix transcriptional regulator [Alteromonadaceae bacterium]|nr:helix-turn-helix transcriptional regulator [Alteromonadaceae bacterium]
MNKTLGQCLEMYRLALGMKQSQASGETNWAISQQQISRIEKSENSNPTILTVIELLSAYGKTLADLEKDMTDIVIPYEKSMTTFEGNTTIPLIMLKDVKIFLRGSKVKIIDQLPIKHKKTRKMFALKMDNNLMHAKTGMSYPKNSLVIFDATKQFVQDNEMLIKSPEGLVFRNVIQDGSTYFYKLLNTEYPNTSSSTRLKMLARAIECRINVK